MRFKIFSVFMLFLGMPSVMLASSSLINPGPSITPLQTTYEERMLELINTPTVDFENCTVESIQFGSIPSCIAHQLATQELIVLQCSGKTISAMLGDTTNVTEEMTSEQNPGSNGGGTLNYNSLALSEARARNLASKIKSIASKMKYFFHALKTRQPVDVSLINSAGSIPSGCLDYIIVRERFKAPAN